MYNPYGYDQLIYNVKSSITCCDGTVIPFDDGTHRIFIYPGGREGNVSDEFRNLMAYINESTVQGELSERINQSVLFLNADKEWRRDHMTYEMKLRETYYDGVVFGRAEGIAIGKVLLLWEEYSHEVDAIAAKSGISAEEVVSILQEAHYIE